MTRIETYLDIEAASEDPTIRLLTILYVATGRGLIYLQGLLRRFQEFLREEKTRQEFKSGVGALFGGLLVFVRVQKSEQWMANQEAALSAANLTNDDQEGARQILHQHRKRIERAALSQAISSRILMILYIATGIAIPLFQSRYLHFSIFVLPPWLLDLTQRLGQPHHPTSSKLAYLAYVAALLLGLLIKDYLALSVQRFLRWHAVLIWLAFAVAAQRLAVVIPREARVEWKYGFAWALGIILTLLTWGFLGKSESFLYRVWTKREERRWMQQLPEGIVVSAMLSVRTEAVRGWENLNLRSRIIRFLELGAIAIEYGLTRLPTADAETDRWLAMEVRSRVAGVRALKQLVCLPGSRAKEDLIAATDMILSCMLHGDWRGLPVGTIGPSNPHHSGLRKVALACVKLSLSLMPLIVVIALSEAGGSAAKSYLPGPWAWAGLGILSMFDPDAGKKAGAAKEMVELSRTLGSEKSGK